MGSFINNRVMKFDKIIENEMSREDRIKALKKGAIPIRDFQVNTPESTNRGTQLMGYITVPYNQMVAFFGKPKEVDDDKSSLEWVITYHDGEIATIYDWWTDQASPQDFPNTHYHWHIGGNHPSIVPRLANYLGTEDYEIASHVRHLLNR